MKKLFKHLQLPWMRNRQPDPDHFYRRGFTSDYRARRRRLKELWIGSGLLALVLPEPAFWLILLILSCFISFAFLDEHPQK